MKKIIDGKSYNTETAKEICSYWNGLSNSDFRNVSETLYVTAKGTYFIHGCGGAMTRWSNSNGNTSWGSSGIEVLTEGEAREWLERHGTAEQYESVFSVEEG